MLPRPRLSLALLVRDEEATLAEAIASARPFVDEVVVRDSGSRDDSVAIATAAGARLLRGRWRDDFADARNRLLDACTGDWVLVLDGDERLAEGGEELARLTADAAASCFAATVTSPAGPGRTARALQPRLFRRRTQARYHRRVHEQLAGAGEPLPSTLAIDHRGWSGSRRAARCLRNLSLLQLDLRRAPADPYLLWCKGHDLDLLGRHDEALAAWEEMAAALRPLDVIDLAHLAFLPLALSGWVDELELRGEGQRGLALCTRGALAHPARPFARWAHVRALLASGRERDGGDALRALLRPQAWRCAAAGEDEVLGRLAPSRLGRLGAERPLAAALSQAGDASS